MNETLHALLTPREAADKLGITYSTLKRWILAGRIRTIKTPGGHHRIQSDKLIPFLPRAVTINTVAHVSEPNRLIGTVVDIRVERLMAKVLLRVDIDTITAIISADAVEALALKPGDSAVAVLPAVDMTIGKAQPMPRFRRRFELVLSNTDPN